MRAVIEAGTDVASVCFFDPGSLPETFKPQSLTEEQDVGRELGVQGLVWWQNTGADGGYLFHFYVDEEIPERIRQHCWDSQHINAFQVPTGTIWACGAEYAARDPEQLGLKRFPHMGQRFALQPGNYSVEVWRTEWPDEIQEEEIKQRCGERDTRVTKLLGPITGFLFVATALATLAVAAKSMSLVWNGGWESIWNWTWLGIGSAWLAFALLARALRRAERNPIRREAEREFPSIVVKMSRNQ